jgi:hypothetical protein
VAGLFTAFDAGRELTTDDMLEEASHAVPLAVMMREEIEELRTWAQLRTRPASSRAPMKNTRKRGSHKGNHKGCPYGGAAMPTL